MSALLMMLALCFGPLPQHARQAWHERYILLMSMSPTFQPLPSALAEAGCPPLRMLDYSLPIGRFTAAELDRNRRLYGEEEVMLSPEYVVLHFTVIPEASDVLNLFNRPVRLPVGNQQPVKTLVTVHYMVDKDGVVLSLVPEDRRTSGTYGLDHRALAIEMVAADEKDLMTRPAQLLAAFCLIDGLLKKYDLPVWRVLSHQDVAFGKLFLDDYTDIADTEYPYFYPKPSFRFDPGPTVMAWCREFLLRKRGLWERHPAAAMERPVKASPSPSPSP